MTDLLHGVWIRMAMAALTVDADGLVVAGRVSELGPHDGHVQVVNESVDEARKRLA